MNEYDQSHLDQLDQGELILINKLIERETEMTEHKYDYGPMSVASVGFLPDMHIAVQTNAGVVRLKPTRHACLQVLARLGSVAFKGSRNKPLPADYLLDACDHDMASSHLNQWIQKMPGARRWLVRGYDDLARAVVTDKYTIINNVDVLGWISDALTEHKVPARINSSVGRDDLWMRIFISETDMPGQDGEADNYAIGAMVRNSEIGTSPDHGWGALEVQGFVQRTACTNSIMYRRGEYNYCHRHTGSRRRVIGDFQEALFKSLKGSWEILDRLQAALHRHITDEAGRPIEIVEYIQSLGKKYSWAQNTTMSVVHGTEGNDNLWGLVQGISSAANTMEKPEDKMAMQELAGNILFKGTK